MTGIETDGRLLARPRGTIPSSASSLTAKAPRAYVNGLRSLPREIVDRP